MDLRSLHRIIAKSVPVTRDDVLTHIDDDDCAVVRFGQELLVMTTDFINSSPAIIELGEGSWYNLGQLVVCHNLADLAGAGCSPRFFLCGICVPHETNEKDILQFVRGVNDVCLQYKCCLVGGDTKIGRERAIFGTAIGAPIASYGPFLRTQSKAGYKIVVSSQLGGFAAAVACLGSGKGIFDHNEIQVAKDVLLRTTLPFPLAEFIASHDAVVAGTDISDGLATDLMDICYSSGLSANIDVSSIPVDNFTKTVASRLDVPPWSFAFASGGDFACIFGLPDDIADACIAHGGSVIGKFLEGPSGVYVGDDERPLPTLGHRAERTLPFSHEIIASVENMRDSYGS